MRPAGAQEVENPRRKPEMLSSERTPTRGGECAIPSALMVRTSGTSASTIAVVEDVVEDSH